jgi:hypothetical protein
MSHIPDMHKIYDGPRIAVGWLHPDHEFPKAPVPVEFLAKLKEFSRRWGDSIRSLGWGAAGGFHTCKFCGEALASGTFGVPAGNRIFDAPEMIAHYVERHDYAPPAEFISAVMACPLPGTPEYEAAVAPFATRYT